jgi:3-hydroxyacyl-[acyl-carrier-protein] dehydratase
VSLQLVDQVRTLTDGRRIVALKSVSSAEPFFRGHFPGYPVMPGVLICDALAQAAGLLLRRSSQAPPPDRAIVLVALDRVRFRRPVLPGDELELDVTLTGRRSLCWKARGVGRVGGAVVAEADLVLAVR